MTSSSLRGGSCPMTRQAIARHDLAPKQAVGVPSSHLDAAERESEGEWPVGAIWYDTERSRANASSVNEKETPCVAAACRVAITAL
jgi:hypothetical protein